MIGVDVWFVIVSPPSSYIIPNDDKIVKREGALALMPKTVFQPSLAFVASRDYLFQGNTTVISSPPILTPCEALPLSDVQMSHFIQSR